MKKSNNNKGQMKTSTTSELLNLDPETRGKLLTVSNLLDRSPSEVIFGAFKLNHIFLDQIAAYG
jgi:hypothetical protein